MTHTLLPRSSIPACDDAPRGTWWKTGELVSIKCALCGRCATLRSSQGGHAIAADGTASPSVVCPYDACSWHVFVKLVDWV